MKTLKIQIPNMQSSHCQVRVNNALSTISGATAISTKPGEAQIMIPKENSASEVIIAIEKAGYYVIDISSDLDILEHTTIHEL
ncbi:copper chaperone [Flavobacteriaceae bacterium MAR_2010_72]|nr:copper chaperone [Flavobacteriaceae bacterium MAR_2010_72]